jgi:ATP-dependent exoDNAse (exonuclease V) alpha subunit
MRSGLRRHDRLHSAHPVLVASQVARAHREHVAAGRSVAITTNTAETARAINREIQRLLHPWTRNGADLRDATTVYAGDTIATRRNEPRQRTDHGDQVRNRQTWTVDAVHPDGGLTVRHDERGTVELPPDYVARHVELGWAVTGYGNQGDTVDIGLAVLEAGTNRNHAYVALTRGRISNTAWIPDPTGTIDPADQLAAMIAYSADRDSALAVHARLHREAGVPVPQLPGADLDRPTPPAAGLPTDTAPGEASIDQRVRAMQERLDLLERQAPDRSLGR